MTAGTPRLLVRTEAGAGVGFGHAMRCLALASGWRERSGDVAFLMSDVPPGLARRLRAEGISLLAAAGPVGSTEDAAHTRREALAGGFDWVVVDGYGFGADFQDVVRTREFRTLVVDDDARHSRYAADLVLNQNLHAGRLTYRCAEGTTLLLGTRWVLLRREFRRRRRQEREIPERATKLLVTFGGGDPGGATRVALGRLREPRLAGLDLTIVVGPSHHDAGDLSALLGSFDRLVVDPPEISDLMAGADVAISAAGSTAWELAYMGVPALLVVAAENQRPVAAGLAEAGAAEDLGPLESAPLRERLSTIVSSRERRCAMIAAGRNLVDGEGVERVIQRMRNEGLRLRDARVSDAELLLAWRNESAVRDASFSHEPISREEHVAWLARRLEDDRGRIYVAMDLEDAPIGQIRFDIRDDQEAEIGISVDASRRGTGLGADLLRRGAERFFRETPATAVFGRAKPGNVSSCRAFARAGFVEAGTERVGDHQAIRWVLARPHA